MEISQSNLNTILLVEDDEASRNLMREAFRLAEYEGELHTAENAEEAFRFLRQEKAAEENAKPDLILLDLNLPGRRGPEIMREIRNDEKLKEIPVVVLTGSNAARDIQTCTRYGCKYLLKPSRFHELVNLVKSLPEFC